MELDYSALDGILNYLKLEQGYRGWKSYQLELKNKNVLDTIIFRLDTTKKVEVK